MSPDPRFLLLLSPGDRFLYRHPNVIPALLFWRLSPQFTLLRHGPSQPRPGCILAVSGCDGPLTGSPDSFCRHLEQECLHMGARGVLLDFDQRKPCLSHLIQNFSHICIRRGWELFLPEWYAPAAPKGKVLISSALSGGTLPERLEQAVSRFGPDRIVLALERAAEDFTLPAPTGCGTPLSPSDLEQLRRRLSPPIFFSRELCARYFTYRNADGIHFVLFDDPDTLCRKLECARHAGIRTVLLPWQEVCRAPERFGLPPVSTPETGQNSPSRTPQNFSVKN